MSVEIRDKLAQILELISQMYDLAIVSTRPHYEDPLIEWTQANKQKMIQKYRQLKAQVETLWAELP